MEEGIEGFQRSESSLWGNRCGRNELILVLEERLEIEYSQLIGEGWVVAG
jgi:hypothetical protein